MLQTQYDTMKIQYENHGDHENLRQENELFRNAIDQWSNRYEELKLKLEQTTKYSSYSFFAFHQIISFQIIDRKR